MDDLMKPPTSIEVAELIDAVKHEAHGVGLTVLRRLALHRDRQTTEIEGLKAWNAALKDEHKAIIEYRDKAMDRVAVYKAQNKKLRDALGRCHTILCGPDAHAAFEQARAALGEA